MTGFSLHKSQLLYNLVCNMFVLFLGQVALEAIDCLSNLGLNFARAFPVHQVQSEYRAES